MSMWPARVQNFVHRCSSSRPSSSSSSSSSEAGNISEAEWGRGA